MDDDPLVNIEHVQEEVYVSIERARELLCEAKLALRQRSTSSAPDRPASASPAAPTSA